MNNKVKMDFEIRWSEIVVRITCKVVDNLSRLETVDFHRVVYKICPLLLVVHEQAINDIHFLCWKDIQFELSIVYTCTCTCRNSWPWSVWFQKISIPPPPPHGGFFPVWPPSSLDFLLQRASCYSPHPLEFPLFFLLVPHTPWKFQIQKKRLNLFILIDLEL